MSELFHQSFSIVVIIVIIIIVIVVIIIIIIIIINVTEYALSSKMFQ